MTTITPFDCLGRSRYELVIEKGQGCFQGWRAHLVQGVTNPCAPLDPVTPLLQLPEGTRRAAPPVKQGLDGLHDVTQLASLRQAPSDGEPWLALAGLEATCAKHKAPLEQAASLLLYLLPFAGQAARRLVSGRRATP
jgi:hypothetical protein